MVLVMAKNKNEDKIKQALNSLIKVNSENKWLLILSIIFIFIIIVKVLLSFNFYGPYITPDEIRSDPGMRHIADGLRCERIPPDDLRPGVPGARAAVVHEEPERFVRALLLIQADKRADRTHFVWRIINDGGVRLPADKILIISVESVVQLWLRDMPELTAGENADRRRCRVEVTQLRAPRNVVDPVVVHSEAH